MSSRSNPDDTRKLHRSGDSTVMSMSPQMQSALGVERGDRVAVFVEDGELRIRAMGVR